MNSDELSRKLAMHFEPEPKWTKQRQDGRDALSDDGWWWSEWHNKGDRDLHHALEIGRPEITLRLLKFLLERGKTITMTKAPNGEVYFVGTGEPSECHTSLKLAVAQAAVREIEGK